MKLLFTMLIILCFVSIGQIYADHEVTRLEIYPPTVTMYPRYNLQFCLMAHGPDGTHYTPDGVEWQAEGGSVTPEGLYSAGNRPGRYTVTARWRGLEMQSHVIIKRTVPQIAKIVVSPAHTTLYTGGTYQFEAKAYDSYNRPINFSPEWSATGGGKINETGFFKAWQEGEYMVVAKDPYSRIKGMAKITVQGKQNVVHRIEITPAQAVVPAETTAQFSACAYNYNNQPVPFRPIWGTTGGRIDQNGYFTAGHCGNFDIWVKDSQTGIKAIATVQVVEKPAAGRIEITNWDVGGGNFFRPKGKIKCKVYGDYAQKVTAFGIYSSGKEVEFHTLNCKDGEEVFFNFKFDAGIRWVELRLYDNMNKVIARYKRVAD